MTPYTPEQKRAIMAIWDACEVIDPDWELSSTNTEFIKAEHTVFFLLNRLTGRMIDSNSWVQNIRRWRREAK